MISKLKLTFFFITLLSTSVFAQNADDIIGKYRLPNELEIEIVKNGKYYVGKIIALNDYKNGETKDVKNPDKSKGSEPLLGKVIIKELEFDKKEKKWLNGTIYGVEKGIFLHFKITEFKDHKIKVVASKYFFWKTMFWKKS